MRVFTEDSLMFTTKVKLRRSLYKMGGFCGSLWVSCRWISARAIHSLLSRFIIMFCCNHKFCSSAFVFAGTAFFLLTFQWVQWAYSFLRELQPETGNTLKKCFFFYRGHYFKETLKQQCSKIWQLYVSILASWLSNLHFNLWILDMNTF